MIGISIFAMLWIKIAVFLLCGILNAWGGYSWHNARRYIMPVLLAIATSLVSHVWWLGITVLPVIGTLVLGYKRFGMGNFSRALWLLVQAFVIGLGLTLTHHLEWYFYVPYILVAGILGGSLVKLYQTVGDCIEGCWLGLIVFFIK